MHELSTVTCLPWFFHLSALQTRAKVFLLIPDMSDTHDPCMTLLWSCMNVAMSLLAVSIHTPDSAQTVACCSLSRAVFVTLHRPYVAELYSQPWHQCDVFIVQYEPFAGHHANIGRSAVSAHIPAGHIDPIPGC